jgi:hypothetical protein
MPDSSPYDPEQRILLDALVSYADACTLPALTPTCPFFRIEGGRPTCGEECRDIAQARGAEPRRIRSRAVGGLVLHGRELPERSVAGHDTFDAAEVRLRHEHDEVAMQPTTSLLAGLRDIISKSIFDGTSETGEGLAYWGELDRRGFPVQMVATHGMTSSFAAAIGVSVVIPLLIEAGLTPLTASVEVRAELATPHRTDWTGALRQTMLQLRQSGPTRLNHTLVPNVAETRAALEPFIRDDVTDEQFAAAIDAEPLIAWALSQEATLKVGAWLTHLFDTDLEAALATTPPEHAATFAAFPARGEDEVARWLSDRFLITDFDQWSPTSLVLEWRHQSGVTVGECPPRILAERTTDRGVVGEHALSMLGERQPRRIPPQPLHPSLFVMPATQALSEGRWAAAIDIFRGLVRLLPTDHDSWNNLGFCELAVDPKVALATLTHAATLRHRDGVICAANRTLALHRLGRDDEAVQVADERLRNGRPHMDPATMWAHPAATSHELTSVVAPTEYLQNLRDHILAGEPCGPD